MIRKYAIAACIALSITGCGTIPASINNPIGLQQLAQVEQSYKVALGVAVAYIELPTCRRSQKSTITNPCGVYETKLEIQKRIRQAQIARRALSRFVRENPSLDASSAIAGFSQAAMALNEISNAGAQ